jgi:transcription termination factor Rho
MAVLTREALEASPLADLHLIAKEIGLDGFRRLRKADLVDAILEKADGAPAADADAPAEDEAPKRRRGGRGRGRKRDADADAEAETEADDEPEAEEADEEEKPARGRGRGRSRTRREEPVAEVEEADEDEKPARGRGRTRRDEPVEETVVEGTVEVLANGSGFLRVSPPEPSDDDVYVSAAQIRRCELVGGDVVAGPVRAPRRSERYPSLVRVDTINGRAADEVAEGTPFDSLPATFPTERFELGDADATLKAIEWLTPIGRGSRAVVVGPARSGKTEALRRLAVALQGTDGLDVAVVLAGARPEELSDWKEAGVEPAAVTTLGASSDAQTSAVERAIDTAKRLAARGGDAVVIVDDLSGVHPVAARRALAAARNIVDGGSLTVVAAAPAPLGGETAVIALDVALTSTGRLPALDLVASGTIRPELLVGEAGATAIAQARLEAIG